MPVELTLYGETPDTLFGDVYFRSDFVALHARPDGIDSLELQGFRHAAAVRAIPGTDAEDMETPWGYGGPIARDVPAFWEGLALWRQRQANHRRVAEFVRVHPFINPIALRGFLDQIRLDRLTVLVDLAEATIARRRRFTKGTRYSLAQAERNLSLRRLGPADARLFQRLYEDGLVRNAAIESFFLPNEYYEELLNSDFAHAWVAERSGEALAVACFIHGETLAHYHLSGGSDAARASFAHYLLLENAIEHYRAKGCRWMHLGGGRSNAPDDALFRFKTRFGSKLVPFYTGGLVHDRLAFERLTLGRRGRFLSYRFPPVPDLSRAPVEVKLASIDDYPAFFRIKCDLENIVWSGHGKPPDWSELGKWFSRHASGGTGRSVMMAHSSGRTVGYAYVDDHDDRLEATVGVAVGEGGYGVGRAILREVARLTKPDGRPIEAWIFPENRASVRAFEAAGFERDEQRAPRSFVMPLPDLAPREQRCWVYRESSRTTRPRKSPS
jgi:RimJ/RimL family protein N-acetyltransferase